MLEALAAVLVVGPPAADSKSAPLPAALPGDPHFAVCRRIARRALAGAPVPEGAEGATRYHHADVLPGWARGRMPSGTLGEFVFYP